MYLGSNEMVVGSNPAERTRCLFMSKEGEPPQPVKRFNHADLSTEDKINFWEAMKKKDFKTANEIMKRNLDEFKNSCSSMDKMEIS